MTKRLVRTAAEIAAAIDVANIVRQARGEGPVWSDEDMERLRALGDTPLLFEGEPIGNRVAIRITRLDGTEI